MSTEFQQLFQNDTLDSNFTWRVETYRSTVHFKVIF